MIDDKDLSINRSIKMWDNLPLDSRAITESLSEMDKYITYPYVGMVFYSKFEDDYYKVLSLEDGYKNNRNGEVYLWDFTEKPEHEFKEVFTSKKLIDVAKEGAMLQFKDGKYELYSTDGYDMLENG